MLTDKQLECATRKLCQIRGIDPDSFIVIENKCGPGGVILDVLTMSNHGVF